MADTIDRRGFIKRAAVSCAASAGAVGGAISFADAGRDASDTAKSVRQVRDYTNPNAPANLLVVAGGGPEAAVDRAVSALGGVDRFLDKGDRVVIKPNVGWDRTPMQAANTNPLVIKKLVELCFSAGASKVVITDNSCNDAARCFTRSGIWKMAEKAGAQVVLPAAHRFRNVNLGGQVLGEMPVLWSAIDADRFINVPVAKHHGLSKFTGALKNLYGVLGGRRNRLHQRIDHSIADLADFIRPTLTILDATRVLWRNGPQGGDLADTRAVGKVVASVDQVAVDAYGCRFIDLTPAQLPYLALAAQRKLGKADPAQLTVKELS